MNKNISTYTDPVNEVNYKDKPDDVLDVELGREMTKRTDKLNDATVELALRIKQAREFIAWSASHMRTSWLDWYEQSSKTLQDVTQSRMAFDRETKSVLASAKDVRDFFNSPEYKESHERAKEMIAMLDRFQTLKANGTLDAFADFILKVSCR